MPSSKQLTFDRSKFDKYIKGDLGIADKIHQEEIQPLVNQCQTPKDKADFIKLMEPNKKTGMWAVEKSFIQTSFESQKPFIELTKIALELLGHLEYITTCISGGPNPFNLPTSYASAHKQNIGDMKKFITGFEYYNLQTAGNAEPITPPQPTLPKDLFLGRFDAGGGSMSPGNYASGKFNLNTGNFVWPQYTSFEEFTSEQNQKIDTDTQGLDNDLRQTIISSRKESYGDEWSDMEEKNIIKKNYEFLPPSLKHSYKAFTQNYQGSDVYIDIEEDYDVNVQTLTDANNNNAVFYVITATLQASVAANNLAAGQPGNSSPNQSAPKSPDPIPNQSYAKAAKFFFGKTLKLIVQQYIPVLVKAKTLMAKPEEYIGNILLINMQKNFEMFDPELKGKPKDDEIKKKYYSEDKFLFDGITNMKAGKWDINLAITDSIMKITRGQAGFDSKNIEHSVLKMTTNLVGLSSNFLSEMLDIFSAFLTGIFSIKSIPTILGGFLTYQSFRNVLIPVKVYSMLGCTNPTDLTTMPVFTEPPPGSPMVSQTKKAFRRLITEFINGFVEIPNIIMNQTLAPPLPLP